MTQYGERIARVEEQVNELRNDFTKLENKVDKIGEKLDNLIALKQKGAGAFWLATTLFGAAIIAAANKLLHFIGVLR